MRRVATSLPVEQGITGWSLAADHALGIGVDDFALYMALRNLKKLQQGTSQNYLVSWPFNPAVINPSDYVNMTSGRLVLVPQIVPAGNPIDGVAWIQQVVGNYTPSNTNGIACYSFDGANMTRLAFGTAAQLWGTGASIGYNIQNFGAQVPAFGADRILWAAAVYNSSAAVTPPQLVSTVFGGGGAGAASPGLGNYSFEVDLASTTLPVTIPAASLTVGDSNRQWLAFFHASV